MRAASSFYKTLVRVILECVQNGIDADASAIDVVIDWRTREIVVTDNGRGTTITGFEQALLSVYSSIKDTTSLGRFGLGLVSPLDKCGYFTFTSIDASVKHTPRGQYVMWTFARDQIVEQENVSVPYAKRDDIRPPGSRPRTTGATPVTWITELRIHDFTDDRAVCGNLGLESVRRSILDKFSKVIANKRITVTVFEIDSSGAQNSDIIKPEEYMGTVMDIHTVVAPTGGAQTQFHLRRVDSETDRRPGFVRLYEWDRESGDLYPQPITIAELLAQAGDRFSPEARESLGSGIFEGEIWTSGARIDADRKSFVENAHFVGLVEAVSIWYDEVGTLVWLELQDERDEARWERSAQRSIDRIHQLLEHDPRFSGLRELLEGLGAAAKPRAKRASGKDGGANSDDDPTGPNDSTRQEASDDASEDADDEASSSSDVTTGGNTTKSRLRTRTLSEAFGFTLDHAAINLQTALVGVIWDQLRVVLNIRNPSFIDCDETGKERWLRHLQEWVLLEVLLMLEYDDSEREQMLEALNRRVPMYVSIIVQGDQERRRKTPM